MKRLFNILLVLLLTSVNILPLAISSDKVLSVSSASTNHSFVSKNGNIKNLIKDKAKRQVSQLKQKAVKKVVQKVDKQAQLDKNNILKLLNSKKALQKNVTATNLDRNVTALDASDPEVTIDLTDSDDYFSQRELFVAFFAEDLESNISSITVEALTTSYVSLATYNVPATDLASGFTCLNGDVSTSAFNDSTCAVVATYLAFTGFSSGDYILRYTITDESGNVGSYDHYFTFLDFEPTVSASASPTTITPNGDTVNDTSTITYTVNDDNGSVTTYLYIYDQDGYFISPLVNGVTQVNGTYTAVWNGKGCFYQDFYTDGVCDDLLTLPAREYQVYVDVSDNIGQYGYDFLNINIDLPLEANAPVVSATTTANPVFSPNSDGIFDTSEVTYTISDDSGSTYANMYVISDDGEYMAEIEPVLNPNGTYKKYENGSYVYTWNGTGCDAIDFYDDFDCDSTFVLPDGLYHYAIEAIDLSTNFSYASSEVTIDTSTNVTLVITNGATQSEPAVFNLFATSNESVTMAWDLDGDGAYDDATVPSASSNSQNSSAFYNTQTVTFRVRATDAYGNVAFASVVGNVLGNNPVVTINQGAVVNEFENRTVNLTTSVSGGNAPIGYVWSGDCSGTGSSVTLNGLGVGTYNCTVSVTDADGDVNSDSIVINILNNAPVISINNGSVISILENQSVTLTTNTVGGDSPYTYIWSGDCTGSASNSTFSSLLIGTYNCSVQVTDLDGDQSSDSIIIKVSKNIPVVSINEGSNINISEYTSKTLTAKVTGGDAPISYEWSGNCAGTSSSTTFASNVVGNYTCTVKVTDLDGDTNIATIAINVVDNKPLVTITNGSSINIPEFSNVTLKTAVKGGNNPIAYVWSGNCKGTSSSATLKSLKVGKYTCTVKVTDADGDTSSDTITINVYNAVPNVKISATPTKAYVNDNVTVKASVSNGNAPYKYSWSGDCKGTASSYSMKNAKEGEYTCTVKVTDADGDTSSDILTFKVTKKPVVGDVKGEETLCKLVDVSGKVSSNDKVFKDAKIVVEGQGKKYEITTNANGVWQEKVCEGEYTVSLNRGSVEKGYNVSENTKNVKFTNDNKTLDFVLEKDAGLNTMPIIIVIILLALLLSGAFYYFYAKNRLEEK